jgi:L-lactate dehydrogenase complex protein LldE
VREEPLALLRAVKGLKLVEMARAEECCGFGGAFATKMESISSAMGQSKGENIVASAAEYVTATDPSCLMHIQGIMSKNRMQARAIHLAGILASE